ncbi:hypothetical protein GLS_c13760 [Gluconobacter oxydans DSM 3504]|uniref:Uncharacterized protein n=1 Tax=Gluconobacter oxydans DSM 3504 TaxID=1288313 RepID=A0A067Z441_GLUOY|nr:hypothetical protein GLS_c13760 [Gluconobacter oxydans DSM 3504]
MRKNCPQGKKLKRLAWGILQTEWARAIRNVGPRHAVFGHIPRQGKGQAGAVTRKQSSRPDAGEDRLFSMRWNDGVLTGFLPLSCLLGIIRN